MDRTKYAAAVVIYGPVIEIFMMISFSYVSVLQLIAPLVSLKERNPNKTYDN